MNNIIKEIEQETLRKEELSFSVGDSVKVYNLIREGEKERVQVYEGVVLKRQGGGNRETFTVRKNSNGVGIEKTFPVNSPMVVKVEVVRKGKARRAKLNYLRDRIGKAAKVKEHIEEEIAEA
ncbi:MAG: 50S ribosomal protein L19 [Lachnospiraceae bacterium]|nr:50S ribosomal protein L19 [Lachnospiraceae bacterium]